MKTNIQRLILLATILWAMIIFILCIMPGEDIPDPELNIPHLDKLVHFGMFFIMSLLLRYYFELKSKFSRITIYAIIILTAFVYGGFIEILQHYFSNREGDLWDLLADLIGAIAGSLCYPIFKRRFPLIKG